MARHVVVDGSNLATEGRTMPSLKQLVDAVQAYMEENPDDLVTVVVDATFGHRIDPAEVAEFDAAIEHNELVVASRRSGRPGRRVRAQDRRQGGRHRILERLLPGVPRRVPLAVRRGSPDRRQARPARRLGVRAPRARCGDRSAAVRSATPSARTTTAKATRVAERARPPASRCRCRRRRLRPSASRRGAATAARTRAGAHRRPRPPGGLDAYADCLCRRRRANAGRRVQQPLVDQRPDAVPRRSSRSTRSAAA